MKILLQFPQGLKQFALAEAKEFEKKGHEVFLSSSPCWGACDLALDEAKKIGAKKLIHYGHCRYGGANKTRGIKVEYHLYPVTISLAPLKNSLPKIKNYKKLALVTTVSHIHQLGEMKQILQNAGHEVFTSKGSAAIMEGQVLGCDASAASNLANNADAIIYVGGGEFHPLGIIGPKPILAVNPYANDSYFINENIEKKLKKERGMLIAASQAKTFGILVSTKSGQFRLKAAQMAMKKLRELKKDAYLLVSSEIDFNSLKDFNSFDAYITTACPRLEDDYQRIEKPIINLIHFSQLLELIKNTQ